MACQARLRTIGYVRMTDKPQPEVPALGSVRRRHAQRLIGLLAVGLALLGAAGLYLYLTFSLPVGEGPAGPPVTRAAFAHPWSPRPVVLVGLGDSVTAGFGARRGYDYFDRLVANPPDEFPDMKGICLSAVFPNLRVTNLSVSGTVSSEHAQNQLPRVPRVGAQTIGFVVITTGGNDLIHNYGRTPPRNQAMYGATLAQAKPWVAEFADRLETIVSDLESRFPGGCHIFLANIYDPTDGVGDIARAGLPAWPDGMKVLAAYNEAIKGCADRHTSVHLVNLHDAFLGHGIHCRQPWASHYDSRDPHYWYYTNLEDPNERGYDAIRRLFLSEMAKESERLR
jgi:lysophospholipase L1-like esterase